MYYCNKCGHAGEGPWHHRRSKIGAVPVACNYAAVKVKDGAALSVQEIANTVAQFLPDGYEIRLCLERGAAHVELWAGCGDIDVLLPDATDKSLYQQINDALCVACGWPT